MENSKSQGLGERNSKGLKLKQFSFWQTLKGNPKLREELLKYKTRKINPEVKLGKLNPNQHEELFKYLSFVADNVSGKFNDSVGIKLGKHGLLFCIYGLKTLEKQITSGKYPMGIQKPKDDRIILMVNSESSGGNVQIAYSPSTKEFIVYQASMKFDLISRGVNSLFGEKGFQEHVRTKDLSQALRSLDNFFII